MRVSHLKYFGTFGCKINVWILASLWIGGIFIGAVISHLTGSFVFPLMRTAVYCRVSIVWLVTCNIFPLLLSAFAVIFSIPAVIECCLLIRALSLGYILLGALRVFCSGAWLISALLLFSSGIVNILIFCIVLFSGRMNSRGLFSMFLLCISVALLVSVVDYLFFAPFMGHILEQF